MSYYKKISDDNIVAIGENIDGVEITENEYSQLIAIIKAKPQTDGKGYRLKTDLLWEEYDIPPDEAPADNNTPAWDISQGEYIPAGFLLNRDGVTYECIAGHYAAWNKQPPNETYWKEAL